MQYFRRATRPQRAIAAIALSVLLGASAADARTPSVPDVFPASQVTPEDARAEPSPAQIARWRGKYCTPLGCAGGESSPLGHAASFAAATLIAARIGRRNSE